MDKALIKKHIEDTAKEQIKSLLNDEDVTKVELMYVRPGFVEDTLKQLGFPVSDIDFDSNGWQWDYWIIYESKNADFKLQISGDSYYKNSCTLEIFEDE